MVEQQRADVVIRFSPEFTMVISSGEAWPWSLLSGPQIIVVDDGEGYSEGAMTIRFSVDDAAAGVGV